VAIPSVYTEKLFAGYLDAVLGETADTLGWSVGGGQYDEAVNETLLAYGERDIGAITGLENLRKLRTLGRVAVWRAVVGAVSGDYDFAADGGDFDRSQVWEHAKRMFDAAVSEALLFDPLYAMDVATMVETYDPYERLTTDEYEARVT